MSRQYTPCWVVYDAQRYAYRAGQHTGKGLAVFDSRAREVPSMMPFGGWVQPRSIDGPKHYLMVHRPGSHAQQHETMWWGAFTLLHDRYPEVMRWLPERQEALVVEMIDCDPLMPRRLTEELMRLSFVNIDASGEYIPSHALDHVVYYAIVLRPTEQVGQMRTRVRETIDALN